MNIFHVIILCSIQWCLRVNIDRQELEKYALCVFIVINNYNEDTLIENTGENNGLTGSDVDRNDMQSEISAIRMSTKLICLLEITIVNFNELLLIIYANVKAERAFNHSYQLVTNTESIN